MKKLLSTLGLFLIVLSLFSQNQKSDTVHVFTRTQFYALNNVKEFLSAVHENKDYSKFLVRSFHLAVKEVEPSSKFVKLSEMSPGANWSERQRKLVDDNFGKGRLFVLEHIRMVEMGKKGMVELPPLYFTIKE